MPYRNTNYPWYKYGFNGKESDMDFRGFGVITDYGMRSYNSRLGRFQSTDPISMKYPELSTYQYASNRPVQGVDLDGLEFYDWQVNLFYYIFVKPFNDFGEGSIKYAQGSVDKANVESGRADFQNSQVPVHVQEMIADRRMASGTEKQITGGTQMVNATADVVSTYVPLATEAALSAKASSVGRWVRPSKITMVEGESFTPQSVFLGGAKGELFSKQFILEGNHLPTMQSYELAGFKVSYNKGSAMQMLYEEHQAFVSSGNSKLAQEFRKQEAGLLSQGKFLEAFEYNATRLQEVYGKKYNDAINQARTYYQNNIVPQLQKQLSQKLKTSQP